MKLQTKSVITPFVCALCLFFAAIPASADIDEARTTVVNTLDTLYADFETAVNSGANLDDEVIEILRKELLPRLDVDRFLKLILARHWKKASAQQRTAFSEILTEFLLKSFSIALVGNEEKVMDMYQKIEVLPAKKDRKEDRASVVMRINLERGDTDIVFKMNDTSDGWKVYDIVFEGVSFAINYRAILNSEIGKHGIDEVTRTLGDKLRPT